MMCKNSMIPTIMVMLMSIPFACVGIRHARNRKCTEAMRACAEIPATILLRVRESRARALFKLEREKREQRELTRKTNGLLFPRLLWKLGTTGTTPNARPWYFLTVICELHCRGPLAGPILPRYPLVDASVPVAREGGGGASARRPKAGAARSAIRPIICPQSQ
jgi:hypothetical protein